VNSTSFITSPIYVDLDLIAALLPIEFHLCNFLINLWLSISQPTFLWCKNSSIYRFDLQSEI
ncbi:hypothetical protein L9F63_021282, partial [Diploptera punctata]